MTWLSNVFLSSKPCSIRRRITFMWLEVRFLGRPSPAKSTSLNSDILMYPTVPGNKRNLHRVHIRTQHTTTLGPRQAQSQQGAEVDRRDSCCAIADSRSEGHRLHKMKLGTRQQGRATGSSQMDLVESNHTKPHPAENQWFLDFCDIFVAAEVAVQAVPSAPGFVPSGQIYS